MKNLLLVLSLTFCLTQQFTFAQNADVSKGCVPLQVEFTAPNDSKTYFWDFGDGVTSVEENPTNIFITPGTYEVIFKESASGTPVGNAIEIKVYAEPELEVTIGTPRGCAPHTTSLQNTSVIDSEIPITSVLWVFSDGSNTTGSSTVTHNFATTGTHDISMSLSTAYPTCDKTSLFSDVVEIIDAPTASFTTNPVSLLACEPPLDVTFTSTSTGVEALIYAWDFGNGNTSTSASPSNTSYTEEGSFLAQLTINYEDVNCPRSAGTIIQIGTPIAEIIAEDTVCFDDLATVTTTNSGAVEWTLDGNTILQPGDALSDKTIALSFLTEGIHTIDLKVTSSNGLCSGTTSRDLYVEKVDLELTSTPDFTCERIDDFEYTATTNLTDYTYMWTFFNGEQDSTSGLNIEVELPLWVNEHDTSHYTVNHRQLIPASITITSPLSGCTKTVAVIDTNYVPNAQMHVDIKSGCSPVNVTFYDSSLYSKNIIQYEWVHGDGTSSIDNDLVHDYTYSTPGVYYPTLIITTEEGCTDTSYTIPIFVGEDLTSEIDFTTDKSSACLDEFITFTPTSTNPNVNYFVFKTEQLETHQLELGNSVSWVYSHDIGEQDITLIADYNGCLSEITKTDFLTVNGPLSKIDYGSHCDTPLEYAFHSVYGDENYTYEWTYGGAEGAKGTTATTDSSFADTFISGDATIQLTTSDPTSGCPDDVEQVVVQVRNLSAQIDIDTLLCYGVDHNFSGSLSADVYATCYTGYTWQFPTMDKRPYTSSQSSHDFSFTDTGDHTVRLIVKDVNGCKDTAEANFKVFDMAPSFDADDYTICLPSTVGFTNNSTADTTIAGYSWSFDDGNMSTDKDPSHTFTSVSTPTKNYFSIQLTVTDAIGCQETTTKNIIRYSPTSTIQFSDNTLCIEDEVTISATDFTSQGSSLTYTWDFLNGETGTNSSHITSYDTPGTYPVKVVFEEGATGCVDSTTSNVYVQDYPVAGFKSNADTMTVLCAPENMIFTDTSQSNYSLFYNWDFGNGKTSTANTYSLFYEKGTFTTRLIVKTSYGCADTASTTYQVFQPEGDIEMDKNTICKGDSITFSLKDTVDVESYTWAFGDGTILDDVDDVTHPYYFHPPSGQTVAKLILRGKDKICPNEIGKTVYIHQVVADFLRKDGVDTTLCESEGAFPFTNISTLTDVYEWDFGDGQTSTELNPAHLYESTGVYEVTLNIKNNTLGCVDTISKLAAIYPNPTPAVIGDTICQGNTGTMSVDTLVPTNTYSWSPIDSLSNALIYNPIVSAITSTVYTVTETDTNNCAAIASTNFVVIEPLNLTDWDTSIVIGDIISLPLYGNDADAYLFAWTPATGLSCYDCFTPKVQPLEDAIWDVEVNDIKGCFVENATYTVDVKPETHIKMPTTFTPNQDGVNDVVYVKGWGIKSLLSYEIYNRWGELIFSTTDEEQGWDGTFRDIIQNSDVYAYKVKVLTWRDEELEQEGYINLVR